MEKLIWLDETKQEGIGDDGDYPATIRFLISKRNFSPQQVHFVTLIMLYIKNYGKSV